VQPGFTAARAYADGAALHLVADPVLDGILHQRLEQHAGHQHIERIFGHIFSKRSLSPKRTVSMKDNRR